MKFIFILLAFFITFLSQAQSLSSKIGNADSVILVEHTITWEYEEVEEGAERKLPRYLEANDINAKVVVSKVKVSDRGPLIRVFDVSSRVYKLVPSTCDQPRNSILIYKNGAMSYIDLCFSCHRYHYSSDLEGKVAFDHMVFKELARIFSSNGIRTEF